MACDPSGKPYEDAEIAVRRIREGNLPGYAVELAIPLERFSVLREPQTGIRFSFAVGLNDADPEPGKPARRNAQGYYPHTWVHSSPQTFAVAVLCDATGAAPDRTKENDRSTSVGAVRVLRMGPGPKPDALAYDIEVVRGQPRPLTFSVLLALSRDGEALDFTLTPADADAPMRTLRYPDPLYPEQAPASYFLCIADYCNGPLRAGDRRDVQEPGPAAF